MMASNRRILGIGAGTFVCCLFLCAGTALGACTKPEGVPIAKGRAPGGVPWSMSVTINSRGPCDQWHFGMSFGSHEFGYSSSTATIPAGGSPHVLTVNASDIYNRPRTAAVFFGYVEVGAVEIKAVAKNDRRFLIRPKLVRASTQRGRSWLGDFRYFVFFHSEESLIESISVLNAAGEVIETAKNEGLFFN
jgi:hypothetical protein